jgi:hypothetical protein
MRAFGRRSTRMAAALAITVGAAALAGCTGSVPDIEVTAAKQLQSSVVAIAQSAAAGDAAGALSRLNALQSAVQADTASGAISGERAAVIRAAIAKVRADLTAAAHSTPPTAAPSPGSSGSDSSNSPGSTPVPTGETGSGGAGGGSGGTGSGGSGSTPPPPTTTSSPSDSPTDTPSPPPPTSGSTDGP